MWGWITAALGGSAGTAAVAHGVWVQVKQCRSTISQTFENNKSAASDIMNDQLTKHELVTQLFKNEEPSVVQAFAMLKLGELSAQACNIVAVIDVHADIHDVHSCSFLYCSELVLAFSAHSSELAKIKLAMDTHVRVISDDDGDCVLNRVTGQHVLDARVKVGAQVTAAKTTLTDGLEETSACCAGCFWSWFPCFKAQTQRAALRRQRLKRM